ncbi:hypothetical protein HZ994_13470 [Akkermansiaceae bacterium]|nr:hypothetical protein HZ994_13470 [Akkermansiaceae bacterium]
MKTITLLFATGLIFLANSKATETPKPLLQVSAKKQVLGTDRDSFGKAVRNNQKTITLRVTLFNTSGKAVAESVLAGNALISRAGEFKEGIARESLGTVKVPAMKPNEKLTLDLGEITLSEVEWGKRKFEESLEEWQVTCSQGEVEIGKAESSDRYALLSKDAATSDPQRKGRLNPDPRRFPRR